MFETNPVSDAAVFVGMIIIAATLATLLKLGII